MISLWNPCFTLVAFEQNFPDWFHLEGAQISQVGSSRMRSLFLNAGATRPLCYLAPQTSSTVVSHERAYIPYINIKYMLTRIIHDIFKETLILFLSITKSSILGGDGFKSCLKQVSSFVLQFKTQSSEDAFFAILLQASLWTNENLQKFWYTLEIYVENFARGASALAFNLV